jgi:hypothetical protein
VAVGFVEEGVEVFEVVVRGHGLSGVKRTTDERGWTQMRMMEG